MSIILATVVIMVFVALFISPYINPPRAQFSKSASVDSSYGFSLTVNLNATQVSPLGYVSMKTWMNSTSPRVENITAMGAWAVDQSRLWGRLCTSGWPIGIGVMQGYYTEDNYSQGTLIRLPQPLTLCPVSSVTPKYFVLEPHGSKAFVSLNGTPELWDLQTTLVSGSGLLGHGQLLGGVYTVIGADEWGDVVITHFHVSQ